MLPFREDANDDACNLKGMLSSNPKQFWRFHKKYSSIRISTAFCDLFTKMVDENPRSRISLEEIKGSEWYKGPVCTQKELTTAMAMFEFDKI